MVLDALERWDYKLCNGKKWNQMDTWDEICIESKLGEKGWLSILRNISSFTSKVTYNVLHPNMAFLLEFALD